MSGTTRPENDPSAPSAETVWRPPGLAAPDSPLIASAIEYARRQYDHCLFNHVIRCWLYAARIATMRNLRVDDDVIAVSTLLHDLGLMTAFSGPHRFEVDGANAARAFAVQHGVGDRRGQLVWDSVALHAIPSISEHKEAEVALCGAGIALDHFGAGLDTFPADELAIILDAFPRLDLKRVLRTCFCRLAQTKPASAREGLVRDFHERFVLGNGAPSSVDLIMNAPFE